MAEEITRRHCEVAAKALVRAMGREWADTSLPIEQWVGAFGIDKYNGYQLVEYREHGGESPLISRRLDAAAFTFACNLAEEAVRRARKG